MRNIWKDFIKDTFIFFLSFLFITFFIYFLLDTTVNYIIPYDKYQEPVGRAVKVVSMEDPNLSIDRIMEHWRHYILFGE